MTEMLLSPVRTSAAWTASELRNDPSWIRTLDDRDIDTIESALDRALSLGVADAPFTREQFDLRELGQSLTGTAKMVEGGRGVALLRGLPVERYDRRALRALYWGICTYLGEAISQNSRGEMIAEVTDRGNDHDDMNVRGYKTRAALAPHVDSCDMTSLLCVQAAPRGGDSLITSSMALYNEVLANHREHLDALYRGFHHDLRGEGVTGNIDEVTTHAFPIFSYHDGELSCAFNSRIMRSAREKVGPALTGAENDAIELIIALARKPELQFRMRLAPGDIQIVNNYSVLHARDAYEDDGSRRELLRMWFRFHRPRRMVPGYGDRYNTGDRGGVAIGDGARYEF